MQKKIASDNEVNAYRCCLRSSESSKIQESKQPRQDEEFIVQSTITM